MRKIILFVLLTIFHATSSGFASAELLPESHIQSFSIALKMFAADVGRLPTTEEGLQALVERPPSVPAEVWRGPYIIWKKRNTLRDPWGNLYIYRYPGNHLPESFDLYSLGADGKSLTDGDDPDDINNWNPDAPWHAYYQRRAVLKRWRRPIGVGTIAIAGGVLIMLYCRFRRDRRRHGFPGV